MKTETLKVRIIYTEPVLGSCSGNPEVHLLTGTHTPAMPESRHWVRAGNPEHQSQQRNSLCGGGQPAEYSIADK